MNTRSNGTTGKEKSALCSWSGGKDSCLSLYRSLNRGIEVTTLLTMMAEDGEVSRSHGIPRELLEEQATAMKRSIVFGAATWDGYEKEFIAKLKMLKKKGMDAAVFGDIDLQEHRDWEEKVCSRADMEAILPIFGESRENLIAEFFRAGFAALVVSVRGTEMDHWLGREFCPEFIEEAEHKGWDPCGENGEYHTFVIDGPIFERRVQCEVASIKQIQNYNMVSLR